MRLLICTQAVDLDDPVLGFFHRWIAEFAAHCEHVHVVCLKEGRLALPKNVTVHSLGKESGRSRLKYVSRFYRYIIGLSGEYDAVFVHMNSEYVVLGGWFWRLTRKRIALWYVHKSVTWRLRIASLFVSVIFTVAPESIRLKSRKVVPMGHGIDIAAFAHREPSHEERVRILTIGRLSPSKRIGEMLDVLEVLHERGVEFSFFVAGAPATDADRSYETRLHEDAAKRSYAADVHFLGPIAHEKVPELLASADVFLNLSETGGIDKAVLEALAAEVPAVTTNEPFRPMLSPNGLFVSPYSPSAVADAIAHARRVDMKALRDTVAREHSLSSLISRIMKHFV